MVKNKNFYIYIFFNGPNLKSKYVFFFFSFILFAAMATVLPFSHYLSKIYATIKKFI